jgi:hypothetical protein
MVAQKQFHGSIMRRGYGSLMHIIARERESLAGTGCTNIWMALAQAAARVREKEV